MCVSNNINPVFNLSSNLSICFHQFPNPFVLFVTFKSDNGLDYNRVIALPLCNIVHLCQPSKIEIIKMYRRNSFIVDLRHKFTIRNMNEKPVFVQSSELSNKT